MHYSILILVQDKPIVGVLIVNILVSGGLLLVIAMVTTFAPVKHLHEKEEKKKFLDLSLTTKSDDDIQPVYMKFQNIVVNLEPQTDVDVKKMDAGRDDLYTHYLSTQVALEVKYAFDVGALEPIRALLLDKILYIIGKKKLYELADMQGRYVLRGEILGALNEIVVNALSEERVFTGIFFSDFVLQ